MVDRPRSRPAAGRRPAAFHPRRHDPAFRRELGLAPETRLLVFIGRNSSEKNIDILLAAIKRLGRDYHLLLMGPGMPHQVPDNVTSVERCCGIHEVARVLASSDGMLHAGTRETFGLVAQEAMASGIPIVGARAGALEENVPLGADILCRSLDPEAMADACRSLFRNDVAVSGRYAHRYVERHFSWESAMKILLQHYRQLLACNEPLVVPQNG